jgi:hypothetical protein
MTYATLLVPVEAEPEIDRRLTIAVDLANKFEARLIGVGAEIWRVMAVGGEFDGGYGAWRMAAAEDLARRDAEPLGRASLRRRWRAGLDTPIRRPAILARSIASNGRMHR